MNVYDIRGRFVRRLVHKYLTPGAYSARFSAKNLASWTYICRLIRNHASQSAKMILLK